VLPSCPSLSMDGFCIQHQVIGVRLLSDFRRGTAQNHFLEQDLAAVDRTVTPWLVFLGGSARKAKGSGRVTSAPGELCILYMLP
jgi:hypothetical protein